MSLLAIGCFQPDDEQPFEEEPALHTASFTEVDMEQAPIDSMHLKIQNGDYGYIDHLIILKQGKLVFDEVYPNDYVEISRGVSTVMGCGTDACTDSSQINPYNYFHPLYHPFYQGSELHTLQSVTKSITAIIVGIAIANGHLSGIDQPILDYFDTYDLSRVDQRLKAATLQDLLTMRLGIEWHEMDRPLDLTNTTSQLEKSNDWIQFTLDQPMDTIPGVSWVYNSGATQLLSGIIKKATGRYIDDYANEYLFKPLGIQSYHWKKTPKGYPDTEGGLYLRAEDLAKIGLLYLNEGLWNGEQIVPADWIQASTKAWVDGGVPGATGYGYQWWLYETEEATVWFGLGFGTQFLAVFPELELVGVIYAWNVFEGEHENILRDFLVTMIESN